MNSFLTFRHILVLLTFLQIPVWAQSFIPLNVDYAVFRGKEDRAYVEIYLTFLQDRLSFKPFENGLQADFHVEVQVLDENTIIEKRTQTFSNTVSGKYDLKPGNYLHSVFPFQLNPAEYEFSLSLTDLNSGITGEYTLERAVVTQFDDFMAISDIQLAAAISKSEESGDLIKNGLKVLPNPSGVFSILAPMVYYYAEIYQMDYDPQNESHYRVTVDVMDQNGESVRQLSDASRVKPGNSAVVVGGQNLVTLPNGAYFLRIKVTDEVNGFTAESRKRFAMFKPQKRDSLAQNPPNNLLSLALAKKPEEELDLEFEQARYLASREEKSVFSQLDKEGKMRFLHEFWKRRDEHPDTPANEFRNTYFQRLALVNERFSSQFKPGWKSDRGRIILVYGLPSEIERYPSSMGNKPYEKWQYDELEGGSFFIFGDLQGFGDYNLLHSTYSRELSQPDWERLVLKQNRNNEVLQTDF